MTHQEDDAKKLEDELTRLDYPTGRRGDARDRAELFASKPGSVRAWLAGRNKIPSWAWAILKLYSLLPAEQRIEYRRWARDQNEPKS